VAEPGRAACRALAEEKVSRVATDRDKAATPPFGEYLAEGDRLYRGGDCLPMPPRYRGKPSRSPFRKSDTRER
jgi:hypothetical protein